jgi:hypothetical protein
LDVKFQESRSWIASGAIPAGAAARTTPGTIGIAFVNVPVRRARRAATATTTKACISLKAIFIRGGFLNSKHDLIVRNMISGNAQGLSARQDISETSEYGGEGSEQDKAFVLVVARQRAGATRLQAQLHRLDFRLDIQGRATSCFLLSLSANILPVALLRKCTPVQAGQVTAS